MLSIIVAMSPTRLIGRNNELPWGRLPNDLRYFKKITLNKPVIMGRRTFNSIGKPLPHRHNIIISRQPDLKIEGGDVVASLEAAIARAKNAEEIMVIGGGKIYELALPKADRLYITYVNYNGEGDTYFPEINVDHWQVISREKTFIDQENKYACEFVKYQRVNF